MDAAPPKFLEFIRANKFEFAMRQVIIPIGYCYAACDTTKNWKKKASTSGDLSF